VFLGNVKGVYTIFLAVVKFGFNENGQDRDPVKQGAPMAVKDKKPVTIKRDKMMTRIRAEWGLSLKVAKACGVTRGAVYQWKRVPTDHIHAVADLIGVRPEDIRPDIFRHRP
jgi:Putative antitoxin of bacterial toxin-antitoxin system, YdaS/YdaT